MSVHSATDERIRSLPRYFHQGSEREWQGRADAVDVRTTDLTYREFVRDYVKPKRPVVIKHGVSAEAVTPATIGAACGTRRLSELQSGGGGSILVRGRESAIEAFQALQTVGEYMTRFEQGADLPYLTNLCIEANFPELQHALKPPAYFQPNWRTRWPLSRLGFEAKGRLAGEVFIGPPGSSYGMLHYDRHALYLGICQYYGRKLWWLCPPEQSPFLYPIDTGYPHVSLVDPFRPDYAQYPLFAQVRPSVVTLEAGDIMFVPAFWWHLTNAITANISGLIRFVNRHNVAAHVWDMRYYVRHQPLLALNTVRRLIARS